MNLPGKPAFETACPSASDSRSLQPSSDMEDLERRLKTHFAEVTSSHWVSAHDKCCSFEDAYMEAAENEILALEAEPSEEADGKLLEASSESE
ncbi:hypothetical protein H310_02841 [Aphanomyces invadans]|uniref:Uncharacterized protein n=1 Tax=Aphanomyces invadans TaxID=157072 RepID=A0A024UKD9_9STRA|nr:hypothetical protein H310_02841 [Aphanomyces invadans]ETW06655.1 hypothetical protein H310_02841 [Aphanomyces invadans]|eukprot:XP_008864730.1 hypothetical protein H310_02841 [Aphanomyces invadans]